MAAVLKLTSGAEPWPNTFQLPFTTARVAATSLSATLRKPQRRLTRLPTDFSPSPPLLAVSPAASASVDSHSPTPAARRPSSVSDCSSSPSSPSPASRRSLSSSIPPSSVPSFRPIRRRWLHFVEPAATATATATDAVAELSEDDDEVIEEERCTTEQRLQQQQQQQEEEERKESEDSLPALETEDGRLMGQPGSAQQYERKRGSLSDSITSSTTSTGGSGSGQLGRCIDLTGAAVEDGAEHGRKRERSPLGPLRSSANSLLPASRAAGSADSSRKRGRHEEDKENSSALQYITSVCEAVRAARLDRQRKRRSEKRKLLHEVIELMSEHEATDDEDDDATVTHVIRQPVSAAAALVRAAPSDRSSSLRPCVESVKDREVRASLPGYACPDCHAFHSVAHGERAGHFEMLCRHRYSQSATRDTLCTDCRL